MNGGYLRCQVSFFFYYVSLKMVELATFPKNHNILFRKDLEIFCFRHICYHPNIMIAFKSMDCEVSTWYQPFTFLTLCASQADGHTRSSWVLHSLIWSLPVAAWQGFHYILIVQICFHFPLKTRSKGQVHSLSHLGTISSMSTLSNEGF